jgi:hypothetical protein
VIVARWLAVLTTIVVFYFRKIRTFGSTRRLLAVVAIDTLRNIVENISFAISMLSTAFSRPRQSPSWASLLCSSFLKF